MEKKRLSVAEKGKAKVVYGQEGDCGLRDGGDKKNKHSEKKYFGSL